MRYSRTVVVVVVGLVLTVAGTLLAAWDTQNDLQQRLDERADRVAAVLELELERYSSASRALAAIRADEPTQDQWLDRVDRLGIDDELASVYSLASATAVEADGARSLVIDLVAPMAPNEAALGLDLTTVPGAAPAALRALDAELPSLSDALTLVQEPGDQAGLVVYTPWYDATGRVGGVTDVVLRGQDLLDALSAEIGDIGVVVTDVETPDGPRELGAITAADGHDESLRASRTISPLGQVWEVDVVAPSTFASTTERWGTLLTLAGLLAVSGLVASLVHVLQRREEHALAEVEARTADLVAANRELAEAMDARDEFLAVITHEFRTPITVIRGFAETAATGRAGELPDEARAWLSRIDRHARRLHVLMDNVLTTAKLQAGDLSVETEVVDLGQLVGAVAAQHSHLAPLDVEVADDLWADVDAAHFVRILDALLVNAGTYGRPPVQILAYAEGREVVVRVSDEGDGVPPDLAGRIFEPFQQADSGARRRSRGVGLGLSVVRQLCERMRGTVRLVDTSGPGATFEVRLPRAEPSGVAAGPSVASGDVTRGEG